MGKLAREASAIFDTIRDDVQALNDEPGGWGFFFVSAFILYVIVAVGLATI